MNMNRAQPKDQVEDAKGLFNDSDDEEDTLFQPVKLNRNKETLQAPKVKMDQGAGWTRQQANQGDLEMFY